MSPAAARTGRPLHFLAMVLAGWTGLRAWLLWPAIGPLPIPARAAAADDAPVLAPMRPDPPPLPAPMPGGGSDGSEGGAGHRVAPAPPPMTMPEARRPMILQPLPLPAAAPVRSPSARTTSLGPGDPVPAPAPGGRLAPALAPAPAAPPAAPSRLSGSAWGLLRGGPALAGGLAGAQLGGSQAGIRLAYAVDGARRLALAGRVSTAIGGSGSGRREASLGVAWRPTAAPVTLFAEQRFVLDGGHGGPTLGAIAGLAPTRVAAGFRLEAYGQAGAIARSGAAGTVEAFGDGAARLTRRVAAGPLRLELGAGAWGGAQRGARRLDVGPTVAAAVPVAGHALRVALDWRARVAGDARPGSGPALSLGTDF